MKVIQKVKEFIAPSLVLNPHAIHEHHASSTLHHVILQRVIDMTRGRDRLVGDWCWPRALGGTAEVFSLWMYDWTRNHSSLTLCQLV